MWRTVIGLALVLLTAQSPRARAAIISTLEEKLIIEEQSGRSPVVEDTQRDLVSSSRSNLFYPGSLVIIPEDNRTVFYEAFNAAKKEIRIEICVLEDPDILSSLSAALDRGVTVRVIVDNRKYHAISSEQTNLATYLTDNGGQLHLSNPIFPRSFPKVILIDESYVLVGSACLDSTTFAQYRDYVYVSKSKRLIKDLGKLFENDWLYSRPNGTVVFPTFNPTPPFEMDMQGKEELMISPVNSAAGLVAYLQSAKKTIDLTTEILGNPTLESELAAAVTRGVYVRLISPLLVNGATTSMQQTQNTSFIDLTLAGVDIHVTVPPENLETPYMHARSAIVDGGKGGIYIGSISLSEDSITFNREVGLILKSSKAKKATKRLKERFELDWATKSQSVRPYLGI